MQVFWILSILQWNSNFREDIRHIAEFLKAHRADIICLQELTIDYPKQAIKNTPLYIAKQLGYHYYAHEVLHKKANRESFTLANGIFSRFPITSTRLVWINQYADERRVYVEANIQILSTTITIATTHLSFTPYFKDTPRKQREANDLLKEFTRHNSTFMFAGDLNAAPDTHLVKSISQYLKNAGPDLQQKTWTTKPFSYQGFEETKRNWRLDYVFTSQDVEVRSAEILETDYSDHLPILVSVSID